MRGIIVFLFMALCGCSSTKSSLNEKVEDFDSLQKRTFVILSDNNIDFVNGYKNMALFIKNESLKLKMKLVLDEYQGNYDKNIVGKVSYDEAVLDYKYHQPLFSNPHRSLQRRLRENFIDFKKDWMESFSVAVERNRYVYKSISNCEGEADKLSDRLLSSVDFVKIKESPIYELYENCISSFKIDHKKIFNTKTD